MMDMIVSSMLLFIISSADSRIVQRWFLLLLVSILGVSSFVDVGRLTASGASAYVIVATAADGGDGGRDEIGYESLIPYQLYTRKNVYDRQTLLLGDVQSVLRSNFNASWPVKMYAGGWPGGDGGNVRVQYLERGDYNFITMDWQFVAPDVDFVIPGIRKAGKHAAAFIDFLMETTGVPLRAFHINGHSAGAHVSGAVGLGFRERHNFNQILPRVTGLDPANFIPDLSVIDDHIDPTDAQQVDIIHTDQFSGILQSLGTVDFFVNGGAHQAGCPDIAAGEQDPGCCNHCRALWIFDESINTRIGFVSYRCDSYESFMNGNCFDNDMQLMGEFVSPNASGFYYLDTNGEPPYARG